MPVLFEPLGQPQRAMVAESVRVPFHFLPGASRPGGRTPARFIILLHDLSLTFFVFMGADIAERDARASTAKFVSNKEIVVNLAAGNLHLS
jgi:hypothetical protein